MKILYKDLDEFRKNAPENDCYPVGEEVEEFNTYYFLSEINEGVKAMLGIVGISWDDEGIEFHDPSYSIEVENSVKVFETLGAFTQALYDRDFKMGECDTDILSEILWQYVGYQGDGDADYSGSNLLIVGDILKDYFASK